MAVNGKKRQTERFLLGGKFLELLPGDFEKIVIPEPPFPEFRCLGFDLRDLPIQLAVIFDFFDKSAGAGKCVCFRQNLQYFFISSLSGSFFLFLVVL